MFIWDLDETIIIFHSLLTGTFSSRFGKVQWYDPSLCRLQLEVCAVDNHTLTRGDYKIRGHGLARDPHDSKPVSSFFPWVRLCQSETRSKGWQPEPSPRPFWVSSRSIFTRWLFCLSALLFLFLMHRGCLATPACCGVIDNHRDLCITDRQLTRGGQRCASWFWPGIRVLNSHGPPAGWHKADGSLRAAFLIGSAPRQAMHAVVSFSFFSATGGGGGRRWGEKKQGGRRQREIERGESGCVEMWLMCQKFLIPPTTPNAPLLDPGKLSWTDSDIKTQTCSGGIEWVTAEKQINVAKRQDSLGTSQRS